MADRDVEGVAGFRFPVNEVVIAFNDRKITGREALTSAGLTPASEHQLVLVRDKRTRLIGTDDKLDLKVEAGGQLRGFAGDRSYGFSVDEVGQVWGADTMEVDELLTIMAVPPDRELVLEREDEPDTVLRPGGLLSFAPGGVEHIVSRPVRPDAVLVTVITTSGVFPEEGAVRVRLATEVERILERARNRLDLGDTSDWVAQVGGRDIDPARSFAENGLTGTVEINWGPREGGGGDA